MRLVFQSDTADPNVWETALRALVPDLDFRIWPRIGNPAEVDMLLAYRLPPEGLAAFTSLKFIQLISAGADQIANYPIPEHIPVTRLVEPGQVEGMIEYVIHEVLHYHRDFHLYERQQRTRHWHEHKRVAASSRPVGIMGLGALGAPVARAIANFGFAVSGWSRSGRQIDNFRVYRGHDELSDFLSANDIIVGLLPNSPETVGMFNDDFFAAMRPGSFFINVGRGSQLNMPALDRALGGERLAGATLDVLPTEPPREEDIAWELPNLRLTPHVATSAVPRSAAAFVVSNYLKSLKGELPLRP